MGAICNVKGVQRLTGCLATLNWFISRLGEQGMLLYKLLKKSNMFVWTKEAQQALDSLKALLTRPQFSQRPLLWSKGRSRAVC
jgi:hypothetical protein